MSNLRDTTIDVRRRLRLHTLSLLFNGHQAEALAVLPLCLQPLQLLLCAQSVSGNAGPTASSMILEGVRGS